MRRARIYIVQAYGDDTPGLVWHFDVRRGKRHEGGWGLTYEDALRKALVAAEALERGLPTRGTAIVRSVRT